MFSSAAFFLKCDIWRNVKSAYFITVNLSQIKNINTSTKLKTNFVIKKIIEYGLKKT